MRKNFYILSVAVIFAISYQIVDAQETIPIIDRVEGIFEQTSENRDARREQYQEAVQNRINTRQENVAERQANLQNRIEERKQNIAEKKIKLEEKRKERVKNLMQGISVRFNQVSERLNQFATNIQSKIDKYTEKGYDLSKTQEKLDEVYVLIDNLEADIVSAKEIVNNSIETGISKESVRATIDEIKESIKSVQKEMKSIISIFKEELKPQLENKDNSENI